MSAARWRLAEDAERARSAGRYHGSRPDALFVRAGARPLLVTAPHAVAHLRHGRRKPADVGTGLLADLLADATSGHLLSAEGLATCDGNHAAGGAFKDRLAVLLGSVTHVVDVHGMSDRHGPDVCLGSGPSPDRSRPLREAVHARLVAAGFSVSVDDPFPARHRHTVTATAQVAGRVAVQVELATRLRRVDAADAQRRLLAALAAALTDAVPHHRP